MPILAPKVSEISTFAAILAPHFYRNHTNGISSARLTFVLIQIVYTCVHIRQGSKDNTCTLNLVGL